jgi:hypothetical protein
MFYIDRGELKFSMSSPRDVESAVAESRNPAGGVTEEGC